MLKNNSIGPRQGDTRANLERALNSQRWGENVVFDYNLNYKINIHESVSIK